MGPMGGLVEKDGGREKSELSENDEITLEEFWSKRKRDGVTEKGTKTVKVEETETARADIGRTKYRPPGGPKQ